MGQEPISSTPPTLEPPPAGRAPGWLGRWGDLVATLLFWLWLPSVTLVAASLMVGHWVTLPVPESDDPALSASLSQLRGEGDGMSWMAVHVLYAQCACSRRIVEHLAHSERPEGVVERMLLVGEDPEFTRWLGGAGIPVVPVTQADLRGRYHIESAPLLVILDRLNTVRYVGGYTDRKQGLQIEDLQILEALRGGGLATALPAFGCGVSRELQRALDPLGLKYPGALESATKPVGAAL